MIFRRDGERRPVFDASKVRPFRLSKPRLFPFLLGPVASSAVHLLWGNMDVSVHDINSFLIQCTCGLHLGTHCILISKQYVW